MGAYNWNNPGESYALAQEQATFAQNQHQEISQIQAQIDQIEGRLAQISEEKKRIESDFVTGKERFDQSTKNLENKMAALMARRGDQGNFWKWKRQTDNYGQETESYNDLQRIELMNEANNKVNEAMKNLSSASGELNTQIAMDALKQAISSRDALRKKLGMTGDNSDIQTMVEKDKADKAKQKETEEVISGYKNQARFLANDKQIEIKRKQIMEDERLSQTQKDQLLSMPEFKTQAEKNRDAVRGAIANKSGEKTAKTIDADKLTLDQFSGKLAKGEALTQEEETALAKKKADILAKYEQYTKTNGSRRKTFWKKWGNIFQKFGLEE